MRCACKNIQIVKSYRCIKDTKIENLSKMDRGVESYSFLLGITDFLIKILYSHLAFPGY